MLPLTSSVLRVPHNDRPRETDYRPRHQDRDPLPFHVLSPAAGRDSRRRGDRRRLRFRSE